MPSIIRCAIQHHTVIAIVLTCAVLETSAPASSLVPSPSLEPAAVVSLSPLSVAPQPAEDDMVSDEDRPAALVGAGCSGEGEAEPTDSELQSAVTLAPVASSDDESVDNPAAVAKLAAARIDFPGDEGPTGTGPTVPGRLAEVSDINGSTVDIDVEGTALSLTIHHANGEASRVDSETQLVRISHHGKENRPHFPSSSGCETIADHPGVRPEHDKVYPHRVRFSTGRAEACRG
ncbi:hypothetical protein, partial [Nannocystis exedens]